MANPMMEMLNRSARPNNPLQMVAEFAEVDPSTVCRWERNGSKIPAVPFLNLCEAYGVDIKDIKL